MTVCDDSAGRGFSVDPKQFFVSSKEKRDWEGVLQNIIHTLGTWGFGEDPPCRDNKMLRTEEEILSSWSDDGDGLTDRQINFPS